MANKDNHPTREQRRAKMRDSQGRPLFREGEVRDQAVVTTEKRLFPARNPGGRRTPILSKAIRETLSDPCPDDPSMTNAEAIALALTRKALSGDVSAAALIVDRSEGKTPLQLNVNLGLAERFARMTPEQMIEYSVSGKLPEPPAALPPAIDRGHVQGDDIEDAEILSETPAQSLDQELVEKLREEARRKTPIIAEQEAKLNQEASDNAKR